jgi:hypothetical protein
LKFRNRILRDEANKKGSVFVEFYVQPNLRVSGARSYGGGGTWE